MKKSFELKNKNYFARAKKSLGQNFLKSATVAQKMVEAGDIKSNDVILEIGPGRGKLTEKILEKGSLVIAIEKDCELFEFLKIKFEKEIKKCSLVLINDDILDFNINNYNLALRTYKLISNIPYNITGAILKKFLTAKHQPASMVIMTQKEVAQRIMASPRHSGASGKESILSISVKAYGEPRIVMKVPARYFSPAPQVDSAVIAIKNISRKIFETPARPSPKEREEFKASPFGGGVEKVNEVKFWKIVKAGFAHKRKKLSSNLKGVCQKDTLSSLGNKRAEDLSLADWIKLVDLVG